MREESIALARIWKTESLSNKPRIHTEADTANHYEALAERICRLAFLLVAHIDITLELFKTTVATQQLDRPCWHAC